MPRYFFHVYHQTDQPDKDGSELGTIIEVQAAAVRLCGEMIRELDDHFWSECTWQMRVTDDERLLFTLTFAANH